MSVADITVTDVAGEVVTVGRDPEGFPTELEARRDAEQLRQEIAKAPIVGEVDEWAREHDGRL